MNNIYAGKKFWQKLDAKKFPIAGASLWSKNKPKKGFWIDITEAVMLCCDPTP